MAEGDFNVKAIISADTKNFDKGMKQAQNSANNLSNTFSNLSKVINKALGFAGLAVGTKAIVDFGKAAVQSATQAIKTFNILDNTVKATGADAWTSTKELESVAKSLSDETNYSVTELEKMQSVLLGFRDITDNFDEASEAVLDMATVMGMDLTSAVQTVGKALDDPIKGLDSLRRQGFQFTDEQKKELAQMVANGKKIEAQKIILDELSRSYGGASKAGQDSFAKQRHAIENFKDSLGGKLIPTIRLFAEENAKMINSFREFVEKVDFNKYGAIIKVVFDEIKDRLKFVASLVKKAIPSINEAFMSINLKPFILTFNLLYNAIKKITDIVTDRFDIVINSIYKLKDSLSNMTANINFDKIAEGVNITINAVIFLSEEVLKVFDNLKENIKIIVLNIWNIIVSIFEASNEALANSESAIKSWKDFFYEQLNNLFKTVQDIIYSLQFLMKGEWSLAWEYGKLAFLRMLDSITSGLDTLLTAFKDKIDKIMSLVEVIDLVTPDIGLGKTIKLARTSLQAVQKVMEKSGGVNKKIKEVITTSEEEIKKLTGQTAPDKNLKDLDEFVTGSEGILAEFVAQFKEAMENAKKELDDLKGEFKIDPSDIQDSAKGAFHIYSEWDAKLLQQRLEKLNEYKKQYTKEYHEIQKAFIESEREKAIQADEGGKNRVAIDEYYNNELLKEDERYIKARNELLFNSTGVFEVVAMKFLESYRKIVKWLNTDNSFYKELVEKLKGIQQSLADKIKETGKKIWDNSIGKLLGLIPDKIKNVIGNIGGVVKGVIKQLAKSLKGVISLVVNTVTTVGKIFVAGVKLYAKVMSSAIKTMINLLKSAFDIFKDLINFNISDTLDVILKFEDAVLTFFIETLPELPKFVSSVLQSINTLLTTLISSVKAENVATVIYGILDDLRMNLPGIVSNLVTIIQNIISFSNEHLADMIYQFLKIVGDNAIPLIYNILDLIESVVTNTIDGLVKWLDEGGLQQIFNLALKIQTTVQNIFLKLVSSVANLLENHTGDVTKFISDTLVSAMDALPQLISDLLRIVNALLKSIADLFKDQKFIDSFINSIIGVFNTIMDNIPALIGTVVDLILNLITALVPKLPDIIIDIISKIVETIPKIIGKIVSKLASVISDIFNRIFTLEFWQGVFGKIGEAFTKVFEGLGKGLQDAFTQNGYGKNSTGSIAGDLAVDLLVPFGFLRHFFANGTNSAPSGLAVVGEAGPELVNFRGGEQVLNSHNTQKALEGMGGTTINQNVTFNNLQDTTAFAMLQQLKQYNRQMAINGII